jgi:hypothetical protein
MSAPKKYKRATHIKPSAFFLKKPAFSRSITSKMTTAVDRTMYLKACDDDTKLFPVELSVISECITLKNMLEGKSD